MLSKRFSQQHHHRHSQVTNHFADAIKIVTRKVADFLPSVNFAVESMSADVYNIILLLKAFRRII